MDIGKPVCVAPAGDICGEGATWDPASAALYWTDINRCLLHRFDEASRSVRSWMFDEPVVALSLTTEEGRLLVALASRLLHFWPATDRRIEQGFQLRDFPEVRLNDGRADPDGNFWVGSMKNNVLPNGDAGEVGKGLGKLFRIAPDGSVTVWRERIGISNTLCWSPDQAHFYFGDTLENEIRRFRYSRPGEITDLGVHFAGFTRGLPDGSAIDAEGFLWNCRYGGGCIVRVAPDGTIDSVVEMPVRDVTTCCFGGEDLSTLYVTTARAGAHSGERLAGSLYRIATGARGLPESRFRIA